MSPNILVFFCDQLRKDLLSFYGGAIVRTPNLNALAAHSLIFDNAHTPTALCSPARASLMTGLYPHRHHMFNNSTSSYSYCHHLRNDADELVNLFYNPDVKAIRDGYFALLLTEAKRLKDGQVRMLYCPEIEDRLSVRPSPAHTTGAELARTKQSLMSLVLAIGLAGIGFGSVDAATSATATDRATHDSGSPLTRGIHMAIQGSDRNVGTREALDGTARGPSRPIPSLIPAGPSTAISGSTCLWGARRR